MIAAQEVLKGLIVAGALIGFIALTGIPPANALDRRIAAGDAGAATTKALLLFTGSIVFLALGVEGLTRHAPVLSQVVTCVMGIGCGYQSFDCWRAAHRLRQRRGEAR